MNLKTLWGFMNDKVSIVVYELKNNVGFHERYSEYSGFMNLKTLWGFMNDKVNIVGL